MAEAGATHAGKRFGLRWRHDATDRSVVLDRLKAIGEPQTIGAPDQNWRSFRGSGHDRSCISFEAAGRA